MSSSRSSKSAAIVGKKKANPAPVDSEQPAWYSCRGWHFDKARNYDFVDKNGASHVYVNDDRYKYVHGRIRVFIQKRLEEYYGFVKIPVPPNKKADPATCAQVYASPDVFVNANLLVIVQGLGDVYPGVWARKLFTNGRADNFKHATQFPYVRKALSYGWAVVLCDPNHDGDTPNSRKRHVRRVWEDVIKRFVASNVMFVAFSAGTWATLAMLDLEDNNEAKKNFLRLVQAVVLLDGAVGHEKYDEWLTA
ncbi:hypothetical protein BGW39_003575, partial [Mortierella sp. 14UC]